MEVYTDLEARRNEMSNALNVVIEGLRTNEDFYQAWQMQIAESFQDEWGRSKFGAYLEANKPGWLKSMNEDETLIDSIANNAAKSYLNQLIK